jgi:hypothetical protein
VWRISDGNSDIQMIMRLLNSSLAHLTQAKLGVQIFATITSEVSLNVRTTRKASRFYSI